MFNKLLQELTFQDIVDLAKEGTRESVKLDYKREIKSESLARTICGMANSYGGYVIIGIEDDKDSKPESWEGIENQGKLIEKINSIVRTNIEPPAPISIFITSQCKDNVFVIIKVEQSELSPHFLTNQKKGDEILVRFDNIGTWEKLASVEQIEWMLNRRKKSEEFREKLLESANIRATNSLRNKPAESIKGIMSISLLPKYPESSLFEIIEDLDKKKTSGSMFPRLFSGDSRSIQNGICTNTMLQSKNDVFYDEINIFGLILGLRATAQKFDEKYQIAYGSFLKLLKEFLYYVRLFYANLNFFGKVQLRINLSNLLDSNIWIYEHHYLEMIDDEINFERNFNISDLNQEIDQLIIQLSKEICWALGRRNLNDNDIMRMML